MSETQDRLLAHERLSTGGLARLMRSFAAHPWRVVVTWLGIIAALIVLAATIGGGLKDKFEIPGSDTQKATDLIESEFASEQGGVLNLVFAAPPGQRLDTPERKAAVEAAIKKLRSSEFKPTGTAPDGRAGLTSVNDPFDPSTFSDDGRIAYAEAQFDRVIYTKDRSAVVDVQDAVRPRPDSAPATSTRCATSSAAVDVAGHGAADAATRRQSPTRANTRNVARSRGSSWNSGIRHPRSSSRCGYVPTTSTSHIGSGARRARTAPKPPRPDSACSRRSRSISTSKIFCMHPT
jgi:hypothetical protein